MSKTGVPYGEAVSRPLDIAMVAARFLPFGGGTETHVLEVGRRMAAAGHRVTVLTGDPTGGELAAEETIEGIRVLRSPARPRGRDWCLAPGIFLNLLRAPPDIVHIQGYHTFSAPMGMLAAILTKTPFVVTFHSGGHSSRFRSGIRGTQQKLLGTLAKHAEQLVGVSRFEAEHFSDRMRIPRDRFVVVPNGAELPKPVDGSASQEGGPLIISLGRLERYKGHHRALAAFAVLRQTLPEARLRLLGSGPYQDELKRQIRELGLAGQVEIGAIPAAERTEMARVIAASALVVLLSDYEAHPVAVMEALSLGRPVLTSDTSGFRELAEEGLVRSVPLSASPEEMAAAMAAAMATGGETVGAGHVLPDWDDCADRLLSIYRRALGAKTAHATAIPAPDLPVAS